VKLPSTNGVNCNQKCWLAERSNRAIPTVLFSSARKYRVPFGHAVEDVVKTNAARLFSDHDGVTGDRAPYDSLGVSAARVSNGTQGRIHEASKLHHLRLVNVTDDQTERRSRQVS
jgi:hypothetical protein